MKKGVTQEDILIGRRARQARKEAGLSQGDLADKLGISAQQIQKFETGKNRISAKTLYLMSQMFDKPLNWFFNEFDDAANDDYDTTMPQAVASNFMYHVCRCIRDVSDKAQQRQILSVVKALVRA